MAVGDSYKAFISYSHTDELWARRLHRNLERYTPPNSLARKRAGQGKPPIALRPIFRDRDDLSAGEDLSVEIEAALLASETLIVICSPHAAQSVWVNKEIRFYRQVRPNSKILCLIVSGDPAGSANRAPERDCFPPALREGQAGEPLAADLRRDADGPRLALLKLIAGLTDLRLDDLVQRDAQHRIRRVIAVTVAACIGMIVMAGMSYVAIESKNEALRQRTEAEGLVDYMLSDLRPLIRNSVGESSVLRSVNRRLNEYYKDIPSLNDLPTSSLELRAYVIYADGQDAEDSQNADEAFKYYSSFHDISTLLLTRAPNDPTRLIVQADSENRLGLHYINTGNPARAILYLERAKALLNKIPGDRREELDANGKGWNALSALVNVNACAAILNMSGDINAALKHCEDAVEYNERWVATDPAGTDAQYALVFQNVMLSKTLRAAGQPTEADKVAEKYLSMSRDMVQANPGNPHLESQLVEVLEFHGKTLLGQGQSNAANHYLNEARDITLRRQRSGMIFNGNPKEKLGPKEGED